MSSAMLRLCIWSGILFTPGALLALFTSEPFVWNGLFVFWLGIAAFAVWFAVMTHYLLRAARARAEHR